MKQSTRIFSAVLALCLSLSTLAGCKTSNASSSEPPQTTGSTVPTSVPTLDNELQRAQKAGFIPDGWLEDMDAAVTFQEYSAITTRLVELWDKDRLDEWKETVKLASGATDEMAREDGFLMLSYAWVLMGYHHDYIKFFIDSQVNPELEYWSMADEDSQMKQLSWDYPCFPDALDEVVYDIFKSNYMWGAVQTFPVVFSPVSGKPVFEWDEAYSLRLGDPLTRDEAVRAIVRMADYCQVELDPDWRDYISVSEAGTYDKSIITDELLSAGTDLPEVTQEKLPSAWKGAGHPAGKSHADQYRHIQESEIRFLGENGFNFTRLFYSFETLRYPDFPADVCMVNEAELKELDQILAWCIQYGLHLQISMNFYLNLDGTANSTMPQNDEEWDITRAYWEMLAERYAGIPSKYLSFDLCNEIEPLGPEQPEEIDFDTAIEGIASVRDVIWKADPDRVLLYSFADGAPTESVDAIAALGIAVGCHCYKPYMTTLVGEEYLSTNPYADVVYPQPFFPIGQIATGQAPLTITGAVSNTKLSFHIWTSDNQASAKIFADGQKIETIRLDGGTPGEDGEYHYGDVLYTADIPEGTEQIDLWIRDGYARLDTIILEGNGQKVTMMPSDTCDYLNQSDPLLLVVNSDGTYTNSENRVYNMDRIYEESVKPYQTIAQKYGVGFMVNEFGCAGTNAHWDINTVNAYHEEVLRMLEKYDLGWCYNEACNIFPKHLLILYGNNSQWTGATTEDITYDFGDHTETIKVCKELLEVFRRHTLEK
nr:hypothetical protein [uncultured Oscillibacter sp.]